MKTQWHFRPLVPGETTRDPIVGEFFATEAINNVGEALVREGIQNSLDAALKQPLHVRISVVTPLPSARAARTAACFCRSESTRLPTTRFGKVRPDFCRGRRRGARQLEAKARRVLLP